MLWFSLLVLIPLAAVVVGRRRRRAGAVRRRAHQPADLAAIRLTVAQSLLVTVVNMVMGTLIAWVLVRDRFWGKRAARRRHRHPVRAAHDRRRPGAAVACTARRARSASTSPTPATRCSSPWPSSRCRSSCAPCSRCSRSSSATSRRRRPRSAPAGSRRSAGSSCRSLVPAIAAGAALSFARGDQRVRLAGAAQSATCPTRPRSSRCACSPSSRAATPPRRPRWRRSCSCVALLVIVALDIIQRRVARRG